MIQILRVDNPAFGSGLTLAQRICYLQAGGHFLFAVPRVIFLLSPLAFLLLGQNIVAASPLAITAYAIPHIALSVAVNSRMQKSWRHSFWSEIYETVLAMFLVRITIATLISPKRGKFNVTDKGGLLEKGYFDLKAVYPNLILGLLLFSGITLGLISLLTAQNDLLTFQALLLNSIWATFSLLIVMAALAVGRERRQMRSVARVGAALPVTIRLPDDRTASGVTRYLSINGSDIVCRRPEGVTDGVPLEVSVDLGWETFALPAQNLRWRHDFLHVEWQQRGITDQMRIVQLVFGRADAWTRWANYEPDRPLVSLWRVLDSIRGLFRPPERMRRRRNDALKEAPEFGEAYPPEEAGLRQMPVKL